MSVFPIEAQVSSEQLLNVVKQLPAAELEKFVAEILKLRAQRLVPSLPQAVNIASRMESQGKPRKILIQCIYIRPAEATIRL